MGQHGAAWANTNRCPCVLTAVTSAALSPNRRFGDLGCRGFEPSEPLCAAGADSNRHLVLSRECLRRYCNLRPRCRTYSVLGAGSIARVERGAITTSKNVRPNSVTLRIPFSNFTFVPPEECCDRNAVKSGFDSTQP